MEPRGFVAVHGGAGYHSPTNSELYKQVCKNACSQAMKLLKEKKSALEAVTAAIMSLEDSPLTNAGTGSNLTIQGTVECDASIMDGSSLLYGSVGAVPGVKNPILVAASLLETQKQGTMSLGRVPPCTMVGHGALEWAQKKNLPTSTENELITESSRRAHIKHKRKLDLLEEGITNNHINHKHKKLDPEPLQTNGRGDALHDTVGAICVDDQGRVVSAVSSGGIVLKQPGRLGQAALYGCGCWAENDTLGNMGVGVSTSGCGEHLIKTLLAKECADCLKTQPDPTQAISQTFQNKFFNSPFIRNVDQKLGGALAVKVDSADSSAMEVEVLWGHTTDSMLLAFMSTEESQPKALISRLPAGKICGKSYIVQSKVYSIPGDPAPASL